jgi:hypothetical protein
MLMAALLRERLASTRCQGTSAFGPLSFSAASANPTWRAARGRPASRATTPYVVTRPGGMRRTTR